MTNNVIPFRPNARPTNGMMFETWPQSKGRYAHISKKKQLTPKQDLIRRAKERIEFYEQTNSFEDIGFYEDVIKFINAWED